MPREATITYDQVARYAESMRAEGRKPTPRLIRDKHGSGSYGTIHKLFQQWEETQAMAIDTASSLPHSLQRSILEFVRSETDSRSSDLEARLSDATTYREELAVENERQTQQLEEQANTIAILRTEKSALEGRLGEIETSLGSIRDEATRERQSAEAARTEVAKIMLRLEGLPRLETELVEARQEYQAADLARQELEKTLAVTRADFQSLEQSKKDAVETLQARLAESQAELRATLAQLQVAQADKFNAVEKLAAVHASRAEEGSRVAERIGALEGALTTLQQVTTPQRTPS